MPDTSLNRIALPAVAIAVSLLGACSPEYEIDRPGTWKPTGVNDQNLRAMIADPRDLSYGTASATDRGSGASRAVARLLTDRRRPLLNASVSRVAPGADTGDSGGGAGGAPAPAAAAPAP